MTQYYDTAEEAIRAAEESGGVDEFDGMNCDDVRDDDDFGCGGWDGTSRRCECGNRRVYWAPYQNDEGKWYVNAEAW